MMKMDTNKTTNDLTEFLRLVERDYPSFNELCENVPDQQNKNSNEDEETSWKYALWR